MSGRQRRIAPPEPAGPEAAMEIALRFLGTRPRTRHEVAQRLRRAAVSSDITDRVLERLATLGYVDDAAFARWWGEQRDRHAPRGRRMIEAELRQRGVPRDVIEAYRLDHASPDRSPEDEMLPGTEEARARDALERHLRGRPMPDDPKAVQRLGMFLIRRGFDPETARSTIRAASTGDLGED